MRYNIIEFVFMQKGRNISMKNIFKIAVIATACMLMLASCATSQSDIASVATSSSGTSTMSASASDESAGTQSASDIVSSMLSSFGGDSSDVISSIIASSGVTSSRVTSSSTSSTVTATPFVKPGETITINGDTYARTFYDDFEGTTLDTTKWSLCPQQIRQDIGGRWSNDCTSLDGNGNLVLIAKKDGSTYKSGAIRSRGKFSQVQGYFECRAKLQTAPGFWGAFWLLSDSMSGWGVKDNNSAVDGVEIDVMESNNVYSKAINNAIHYDGYGSYHNKLAKEHYPTNCYDGQYHTFGLLWTDTAYIWYIDGVETYRTQSNYGNWPGSCEDACYLKVTTEFGSWAATVVDSKLPDEFVVDYVMAYKKVS